MNIALKSIIIIRYVVKISNIFLWKFNKELDENFLKYKKDCELQKIIDQSAIKSFG